MNVLACSSVFILLIFVISLSILGAANDNIIPADVFLRELNDSTCVDRTGVTISGDLNPNEISGGNTIEACININQSIINGSANFFNVIFNSNVVFFNVIFNSNAVFSNVTFNRNAVFSNVTFNGDVSFINSTFSGPRTSFSKCNFSKQSSFAESKFRTTVGFDGSKFGDTAIFREARFDNAIFDGANFTEIANFERAEFDGDANFRNCIFGQTADYSESQFNEDAFFDGAKFLGNVTFEMCKFSAENYASFEDANFTGMLSLNGSQYKNLNLRWHSIGKLVYNEGAYQAIMKNFKDLGYFEDFDSAYFEYRVERRDIPWSGMDDSEESVRKAVDIFLEVTYGYGTKPVRAFLCILIIIDLFGFIWFINPINDIHKISLYDMWMHLNNPKWIKKFDLDEFLQNLKDLFNKPKEIIFPLVESFMVFATRLISALGYSIILFFIFFIKPLDKFLNDSCLIGLTKVQKSFMVLEITLGAIFSVLFLIALSISIIRPMI